MKIRRPPVLVAIASCTLSALVLVYAPISPSKSVRIGPGCSNELAQSVVAENRSLAGGTTKNPGGVRAPAEDCLAGPSKWDFFAQEKYGGPHA